MPVRRERLQESLLTYTRPHVLLVDEVGYLTYGPDARQCFVSCSQRSPPEKTTDDLHTQ